MEDREGELELALMAVGFIAVCSVLNNFRLRKQLKKTQSLLKRVQTTPRLRGRRTLELDRCVDRAQMRVTMKMREPCVEIDEIEAAMRQEEEFLDIVQNYRTSK